MRLHSPDQNTSLKLQTQECRRLVANRHFLGSPIAAAPSSSPHFLIIPIQFHGTSTVKNQDPTCQTSPFLKSALSSIPKHIHVTADLSPEVGTGVAGRPHSLLHFESTQSAHVKVSKFQASIFQEMPPSCSINVSSQVLSTSPPRIIFALLHANCLCIHRDLSNSSHQILKSKQ
jgi:hypothetical protein